MSKRNVVSLDLVTGGGRGFAAALDPERFETRQVEGDWAGLEEALARQAADAILVETDEPGPWLRTLGERADQSAIVVFAAKSARELIDLAVEAGISAFVVAEVDPKRVNPVMDVAIARHRYVTHLRHELANARATLDARKVIERAKGWLMDTHALKESEAYHVIRKQAMDRGQRMVEVAARILEGADPLQRP